MTSAHIVLFNAWHNDNKGDAAITLGTLHLLGRVCPTAKVTVVSLTEQMQPHSTSLRHISHPTLQLELIPNPLPTELRDRAASQPLRDIPVWFVRLLPHLVGWRLTRVNRSLRDILSAADLVIGVGGSNIYTDDSVTGVVSWARLWTILQPIKAATAASIPTVLLGHTIGPFPAGRPRAAATAKAVLAAADLITVRDAASLHILALMGCRNAVEAPDLAYAVPVTDTASVARARTICDGSAPNRVLIVAVRHHPSLGPRHLQRLSDEVALAASTLAHKGHIDHVLVVAHTIGPTPVEDDRAASQLLVETLERTPGTPQVSYLDADLSPGELAALYGQSAAIIAVRLHAAILAMLSGTPTFAVEYFSTKTAGVMTRAGLAEAFAEYTVVTAGHIVASLVAQLDDPIARTRLAQNSAANAATLAGHIEQWLRPHITKTSPPIRGIPQ